MKYELIVFDWDGTLFDSAGTIVNAVQKTAKALEFSVPTDKEARSVIGLSFDVALLTLFPKITLSKQEKFTQIYREWLIKGMDGAPTLFKGSHKMLHELKEQSLLLAIATGKGRQGLTRDLEGLQLTTVFNTTRCGDEAMSKPHPQMLEEIMEELAIDKSKVLMIGDTHYDLQMAKNAGIDSLAVNYGVQEESELMKHEPVGVLSDISELIHWLKK